MDLLNSWPPAAGAGSGSAVEVGITVGGAAEVPRVLVMGAEVAMGVEGVAVTLTVVHMEGGGAVYSSHWPCRSAP